tara:strand:- start:22 stop:408 length:387 start_codon:yes stop_codon:yes gene_type:complete
MEAEKAEAILRGHIRLCSDLHEVFLEEGKIMRSTNAPPDDEFLERKGQFLGVMDKGLDLLQRINENPESFPRALSPLVVEARALVMKILMLDRENERLLLKCSLPPKMKDAYKKLAPGVVAKAYARYT